MIRQTAATDKGAMMSPHRAIAQLHASRFSGLIADA